MTSSMNKIFQNKDTRCDVCIAAFSAYIIRNCICSLNRQSSRLLNTSCQILPLPPLPATVYSCSSSSSLPYILVHLDKELFLLLKTTLRRIYHSPINTPKSSQEEAYSCTWHGLDPCSHPIWYAPFSLKLCPHWLWRRTNVCWASTHGPIVSLGCIGSLHHLCVHCRQEELRWSSPQHHWS